MDELDQERSEQVFDDFKKAYTANQAIVEANRCLYCSDAPCITACPTGVDYLANRLKSTRGPKLLAP